MTSADARPSESTRARAHVQGCRADYFKSWSAQGASDTGQPGSPWIARRRDRRLIRTFAFIRWPGRSAEHRPTPCSIMDFPPTFAAILGTKADTISLNRQQLISPKVTSASFVKLTAGGSGFE